MRVCSRVKLLQVGETVVVGVARGAREAIRGGAAPAKERRAPGVGNPIVVTVNEPSEPMLNVALLALVICGGDCTVTVVWAVTCVVAALVTVST